MAFLWSTFGPYHVARCDAFASLWQHRCDVVGIELGRTSATYGWVPDDRTHSFRRVRLSDGQAEDVGPVAVWCRLVATLRRHRVSVLFIPSYWPATSMAALLAAKAAGVGIVMMGDSHDGTAKATGWRQQVKRRAVLAFDAALVGGTRHRRYFESLGVEATRIFCGYDAVDNHLFHDRAAAIRERHSDYRRRHGLPQRYLLSLGRFVEKKNLTTIVAAYAELRRNSSEVPALVFVGSGPCESDIRNAVVRAGLTISDSASLYPGADVHLHPFVQIDSLPAFYALAEAFVLASMTEEWGLVVNEAMACGTPVIVSSAAGCTEDLVRHGETGLLFDPHSTSDLARCMAEITDNPSFAQALGRAGQQHIQAWGCDRFARAAGEAAWMALGRGALAT